MTIATIRPTARVRSLPALSATLVLAGCGAGGPGAHLSSARRAEIRASLEQIAYRVSHANRSTPLVSPRARERGNWHPVPRESPGEAGRVRASYRTVMQGGDWLSPSGHPGAGGLATVTVYGDSELCWRFSSLHGLSRRIVTMIYRGTVAVHPRKQSSAYLLLAGGAATDGCLTAVPADTLRAIERRPAGFFIAISDTEYATAIGGQL
jgi:hypothetical protein